MTQARPTRRGPDAAPGFSGVFLCSAIAAATVLPATLVGALAVLMRQDLDITEARIGVAVAFFFGAAALSAVPAGRLVDRIGSRLSMGAGGLLSGVSLLGLALTPSWTAFLCGLVFAGAANTLCQLGANHYMSNVVPLRRRGLAFGVKQSAIPAATMLSGVAVPVVALQWGWRPTFGMAALLGTALAAHFLHAHRTDPVPRTPRAITKRRPRVSGLSSRSALALAAISGGFGSAAVVSLTAFLIAYSVSTGRGVGSSGALLAVSSLGTIAVRIYSGWLADRLTARTSSLTICGMMLIGGLCLAALPLTSSAPLFFILAFTACAIGWGWPGLLVFAVARRDAQRAGSATGITQFGVYIGGSAGPVSFGLVQVELGYTWAWAMAATWLCLAAGAMALAQRTWSKHTFPKEP